ncbi:MAG TPA: hypothetical protein VL737_04695 [Candidatus Pristimantibacillus sp.]|nr:hypothetical protein [Candidatus Pristimantibacillus sp.]
MRVQKFGDKSRGPILIRGADGRIKLAEEEKAIDDIWAEQKRIKLSEAIKQDERRAEKRKSRREAIKRLKPALQVLYKRAKTLSQKLAARFTRKQLIMIGGGAVVGLIVLFTLPPISILNRGGGNSGKSHITSTGVLNSRTEKPDYGTVLPSGKTIEELGGWGRVSPPDKDPVFAYADEINGVRVTVSEQPLPAGFKDDVDGSIADLAKQFSASDVVTAGKTTFYIGTSIKGPQSVILTKNGLLILIKSDLKIEHQQWADYIGSLE